MLHILLFDIKIYFYAEIEIFLFYLEIYVKTEFKFFFLSLLNLSFSKRIEKKAWKSIWFKTKLLKFGKA